MGRAPCCEKMGLKRGPWSPEEDRILTTFIHNHGHSNWRALPKLAGLLRCGKSCRLRWTNYLKPDIKRGNFTKEEEDAIINLHELLGNRWSAIAAKLPGRTDNEIKNVWHTHLKKRLQKNTKISPPKSQNKRKNQTKPQNSSPSSSIIIMSPSSQQSSSCEISSATDSYMAENEYYSYTAAPAEALPLIDDSFWSEMVEDDQNENSNSNYYGEVKMEFPMMSMDHAVELNDNDDKIDGQRLDDDMEFWYDVFIKAGGISELPEF